MSKKFELNDIESMENTEYARLRNCKSCMKNYSSTDLYFPSKPLSNCNIFSAQVIQEGVAFNNLRMEIEFDETPNESLMKSLKNNNFFDIINFIEIQLGSYMFDKFDCYSLGVILDKNNLSCEQVGNKVIIPIPFDLISGDNVIWLNINGKGDFVYKSITVQANKKYSWSARFLGSFYECDNVTFNDGFYYIYRGLQLQYYVDTTNIYKSFRKNEIVLNNHENKYRLRFDLYCSDIFFLFIKEDGSVVNEKIFDDYKLFFENDVIESTINTNREMGYVWVSFNKRHNISKYDTMTIELKPIYSGSEKISMVVYTFVEDYVFYGEGYTMPRRPA